MKLYLCALACSLSLSWSSFAQERFQQQADYDIAVLLDDEAHVLHGQLRLQYHNRAPHSLDTLYFHLWPNAYRNRQTAYAKQAERMGSTDFAFAAAYKRGGIDSLAFSLDGENVEWALHPEHIDIAVLVLPKPIPSGGSALIATPFRVDIPASFSRLGHVEQSYQITQWYPKPAVYNQDGWHPMPYLDMGEFYSEFGQFEVRITLPANYKVAATGKLQNEEERQALLAASQLPLDRSPEAADFPPSSSALKTLRYTADRVHDFAWFADKRFAVRYDTLQLPSGKTVEAWAFFTDVEQELWDDAAGYVKRALRFYSETVGEYPYPQATAVQTVLGAGGGMEYPMVTNIGEAGDAESLDEVITHEVGHNWFYGILASNERDHPWMDEGLNSYYEQRYMRSFYPDSEGGLLPGFLSRGFDPPIGDLAYLIQARRRLDQAPDTHSDGFKPVNYYVSAYQKPAMALRLLENYVGKPVFDRAMQRYYAEWQFRHPQPSDFRQVLEAELGQKLDWLFDGLLLSNGKVDYRIRAVEENSRSWRVTIVNKGEVACPFPIAAQLDGQTVAETWVAGFTGERSIRVDKVAADALVLDPDRLTPDLYRYNNTYRLQGALRTWPRPQLQFLTGLADDARPTVFWSPLLAWNHYDKWMPGLLLYNHSLPEQRLEWKAAPLFALGSRQLTGLAEASYNFYPGQGQFLQRVQVGGSARRFGYRNVERFDQLLSYTRLQPYLRFDFAPDPKGNTYSRLLLRGLWLEQESLSFQDVLNPEVQAGQNFLQEARFTFEQRRKINPYRWTAALEHQAFEDVFGEDQRYVKASFEIKWAFNYSRNQAVHLRLFAGYFVHSTFRDAGAISPVAFNLISQGFNDYRYDDFYFGRSEGEGLWSQQVSSRDGGFKNVIGPGFALGRSNNFVFAANFKVDLPKDALFGLPLKPYLDLGYFDNAMPTGASDTFSDQFIWSGGFMLSLADEALAIYFPALSSQQLADRQAERGKYWNRISFQIDLNRLNPWKLLDRQEL